MRFFNWSLPQWSLPAILSGALLLLALASCVIPVRSGETIFQGKRVDEAELQSVERQGFTRPQIEQQLGPPTAWFQRQRILVYGLVRSESGAAWMIPSFPAAAGGYVEFVEREAIFFAMDTDGRVAHAGRRAVPLGTTWLEVALKWSVEAGFAVPEPRDEYFVESVEPDESLLVIYRPRDNQYVFPFVPPSERLLVNGNFFAEVYVDSVLVAQLRNKTFVSVKVPAGSHALLVSPYADYNSVIEYRSAFLDMETHPGTTYFLGMRIEAGKGYIGAIIQGESAETATNELARLRETW